MNVFVNCQRTKNLVKNSACKIELETESVRDIKIIINNLTPPELNETDFNESIRAETRIGIKGIKSRAATLNATVEIISERESGTEVKLEIPVKF